MFITDALLGNFDRHNGNWGFLADMKEEKTSIAPVYVCGSCLYPQMDEQGMKSIFKDEAEIEKRIFVFPTSAIKENNVNTPYISDTHKEFLSTMIEKRRANIIEPALKRFEKTIKKPRKLPNCLDDLIKNAQKDNDEQYE